ncbi:hydrocephalus-inducing protein [Pitangus sulphuratus]|nr:hydrocephalus-inducing protein [Pitangus sulphuratus]
MASGFPKREVLARPLWPTREAEKPKRLTVFDFREVGRRYRKLDSPQETKLPKTVQHLGKSANSNNKLSSLAWANTLLEPRPSEVVFQNYVLGKVCEMPLLLRNRDKLDFPTPTQPVRREILPSPRIMCQFAFSPFTVSPATGTLNVGEAMQVTVEYHPLETGDHSTPLMVHCDRGQDTRTRLVGESVDLNIGLGNYSLKFDKTYLTLSSHKTMVIHNRSDITAQFQWKAFATEGEEYHQKIRLSHNLSRPPQDIAKDLMMEHYEEVRLYYRKLENETAKIQADPLLFSDDIFTIEPLEGEVGPHSSAEIKVFFKPHKAQAYGRVAYCAISGRESRLPLRLTGEGLGPCLQLNFEEFNMGKLFVGETYSYEVLLVNKGAIDAPFKLIPSTTAHGSCFTFLPWQGIIPQNGLQPIQISFSSTTLGEFYEEFHFNMTASPKPVTLTIRGCVTGLSLHFSTGALDFNDVSFGECSLGLDAAGGICDLPKWSA